MLTGDCSSYELMWLCFGDMPTAVLIKHYRSPRSRRLLFSMRIFIPIRPRKLEVPSRYQLVYCGRYTLSRASLDDILGFRSRHV